MSKTIVNKIEGLLKQQAYERGHSAGIEEVEGIERELMADFKEILEDIKKLEVNDNG